MSEFRIAVMDNRFFLYLPLFSACRPEVLQRAGIRDQFQVKSAVPRTDQGAIDFLLSRPGGEPLAHLAACDPILVLSDKFLESDLVVLGAIVANNAFFAVDHGSISVEQFEDLAKFDEIVSFREGTTSYAIATRARELSVGRRLRIRESDPFSETDILTENVEHKRVVLTPNVLEIEQLRETDPTASVELDLGQSPDFSNQIVTALVASRKFVEENRRLVRLLLATIQAELCAVRAITDNPELVRYAAGRFIASDAHVRGAITRSNSSQLWPATISISSPQWEATVKASIGWRLKLDGQNPELVTRATYKKFVLPYLDLVNGAAADGQALYAKHQRERSYPGGRYINVLDDLWPYLVLVTGVAMALTSNWLQPVGVIMIALAVARLAPLVLQLQRLRRLLLLYGAVAVASLIWIVIGETAYHQNATLASVAKILCGATIGQLLAAARDYYKAQSIDGERQ